MTDQAVSPTVEELRWIEDAYRGAAEHAETLRADRNALVRQALAAGWTHAKISEATGLSRGRIGQISQASNEEKS